jgi:hypothetical protein
MARYIALGKEGSYAADVALTEYIDAIEDSPKADNSIIADETMGVRGLTKPVPGDFKTGRTFKFYAESENMGLVLLGLLGAVSSALVETGVYKHTFTPGTAGQYLTAGGGSDVTAGQRTNPGFAVRKAKLSCAPNTKVLVEVDGFGKSLHLDALLSPSFSAKPCFHHGQATAKIATVAKTYIKAMSIEVENKWDEEDYTLGSRELRSAPLRGLVIKGTMDCLFDQLDQLKMFLGNNAAVAPAATLVKQRLDLNFLGDVLIGATQFPQLNLILPETLFKTHKADVNKRDRTIENLEWECYALTSGAQMTIELQNTIASY